MVVGGMVTLMALVMGASDRVQIRTSASAHDANGSASL